MRLYHRTTAEAASAIIATGFHNATADYGIGRETTGVWLSNAPLDANEGAQGETLIGVDLNLPEDQITLYEWVEEGKPYREFLLPAALVNDASRLHIINEDEPNSASTNQPDDQPDTDSPPTAEDIEAASADAFTALAFAHRYGARYPDATNEAIRRAAERD